jgi:hypothetical protein
MVKRALCQVHLALPISFALQHLRATPALCLRLHLHGLTRNGDLMDLMGFIADS